MLPATTARMANALAHLEAASELEHGNASIDQALVTVRNFAQEQGSDGQRSVAPASELPAELPTEEVERGLDGLGEDMVLLDTQGRVLGGHVTGQQGDDVTEAAAAFLAGVSDEAARTSRLLEFGAWLGLSAEAGTGHLHLAKPRDGVLLLVIRDKGVPLGRMGGCRGSSRRSTRTSSPWGTSTTRGSPGWAPGLPTFWSMRSTRSRCRR